MYSSDGVLILSATDLVGFLECEHLLQLDRKAALGQLTRPERADDELELVSSLGDEHERRHLGRYQATFFDGRWLGKADFLLRVDEPSDLGAHSYEVADTKLARHAKARALLQV